MFEIDEKKLSGEVISEIEKKIKELDERDKLSRLYNTEEIKPLGNCPLIERLPLSAIKHCMEKNKDKCHCIKFIAGKCKGGY